MSINYYRKTVLSSKRTESISLHFCNQRKRYVSNQRIRYVFNQRKNIVWTFQLQPTPITSAPPHPKTCQSNRSKFGQFVSQWGLHLLRKQVCHHLSTTARLNQVIKEEKVRNKQKTTASCLCTAPSKINYPAYLYSILLLLSSPCYCIPSIVLTCFIILCTSRNLKTQTNPASLVTPALISLFPGMMAEEQPCTGTMSPGIQSGAPP